MRFIPIIIICLLIYIEASLFTAVAASVGVALTLILVVLTSCLGVSLVKSMGLQTLGKAQQKLMSGENPAEEMIKSISLVLGGILLIIPGFFTDFLGLLLMLPPVQKLFIMRMLPVIKVYTPNVKTSFRYESTSQKTYEHSSYSDHEINNNDTHQNGKTIEGEFERKDDNKE